RWWGGRVDEHAAQVLLQGLASPSGTSRELVANLVGHVTNRDSHAHCRHISSDAAQMQLRSLRFRIGRPLARGADYAEVVRSLAARIRPRSSRIRVARRGSRAASDSKASKERRSTSPLVTARAVTGCRSPSMNASCI